METSEANGVNTILNDRASTGVNGLDTVLGGGFPRNHLYLVQGDPGVGKTTFGLKFLLEGVRRGERGLCVTLSESAAELREVAQSHGWSLDGITVYQPVSSEVAPGGDTPYTFFLPSEVELGETTKTLLQEIERVRPQRLVLDSLSEIRALARDPARFRRQMFALKQFFAGRECTVLMLDDRSGGGDETRLQTMAHGVVDLAHLAPEYGGARRRLRVTKLRGASFSGGYHDFRIISGDLLVFPRLVAAEHHTAYEKEQISSGVTELDTLLGGGLDRGTSTLILGAAGTGKSTIAAMYVAAAAQRGEHGVIYTFDESARTLMARTSGLGIDLAGVRDRGVVKIQQVDPAELPPGEFAHYVMAAVERDKARIVVIDSLNGYLNAMPQEPFLGAQMHELLTFLGGQGVVTILVLAQTGLVGPMNSPADVSYLADTVVLLRYFEAAGELKQALSVVKKRSGHHERTIHEIRMAPNKGLRVGAPLREFQGVFTGVPRYDGPSSMMTRQPQVRDGKGGEGNNG